MTTLLLALLGLSQPVTDLTGKPPVVVGPGQSLTGTYVKRDRGPLIVCKGGASVTVSIVAYSSGAWLDNNDPGQAALCQQAGIPMPAFSFSQHDWNCSAIVCLNGGNTVHVTDATGMGCVMLNPNEDGTPAVGNKVAIDLCQTSWQGVLAAGQKDCEIHVGWNFQTLHGSDPAGHAVYFNESYVGGKFVRSSNVTVTVDHTRSIVADPGGSKDCYTVKLKGVDFATVSDQDDFNAAGAFDSLDSCGTADVWWKSPGQNFVNPVADAGRVTGSGAYGQPVSNMTLSGSLDWSACPNQSLPSFRVETSKFAFLNVTGAGKAQPVVWPGCNGYGLQTAPPVGGGVTPGGGQ